MGFPGEKVHKSGASLVMGSGVSSGGDSKLTWLGNVRFGPSQLQLLPRIPLWSLPRGTFSQIPRRWETFCEVITDHSGHNVHGLLNSGNFCHVNRTGQYMVVTSRVRANDSTL